MNVLDLKNIASASSKDSLMAKIRSHSALVGVVGIGYVGLPLAVEKAKVGFTVRGYDRNPVRIDQVNQGLNYIGDVDDRELSTLADDGKISATGDFSTLGECDVVVICVPTPLTINKDPEKSVTARITLDGFRPTGMTAYERPGEGKAIEPFPAKVAW